MEENKRLNTIEVQLEMALGNITIELVQIQAKSLDDNVMQQVALIRAQIEKINELKTQIKADTVVILGALGAGPLPAGYIQI